MSLTVTSEPVPLRTEADGTVRVGNTRVLLDLVVATFLEGASAEEIVEQFPTLDLADVYSVLGFYLHHKDAVEAYMQERQRLTDEVRARIEARQRPAGIRERLLARRPLMAYSDLGHGEDII
jgi:uncharacterized protein (DUF433 family)